MITHADIHLAQPSDARAIALLSRDAIEHGLPWSWTPARVLRHMADPSTNVVVARDSLGLIGFGIMKYLDDDAHLLLLAVRPNKRRMGAGSALLTWLLATAEAAGAAEVALELRVGNDEAIELYRRHGFTRTGCRPRYYADREDAVEMTRVLRARG